MFLITKASPHTRQVLSGALHKVAAVMANRGPFPINRNEVTLKEAAYLIGTQAHYNWLTKRATLEGIINTVRLNQGV